MAAWTAEQVARPWFFASVIGLIVGWLPTLALLDVDTSQLIINTATTILTTVLVALLHNEQHRNEQAMNAKLDLLAEGLAALIGARGEPVNGNLVKRLRAVEGAERPD